MADTYGTIEPLEIIEKPDLANQLQVEYPVKKVQMISPVEEDSVNCRILTKGVSIRGQQGYLSGIETL